MKRVRFLVYRGFTASSPRRLKDALRPYFPGIKRLWLDHPEMTFMPRPGDVVINWGCLKSNNTWGNLQGFHWVNNPAQVGRNRLQNLQLMKEAGVNVPEFTTVHSDAERWLADGKTVIARDNLRSFGGRGITVVEPGTHLASGKALYTRYQPKRHEYRVHVFRGDVIDVQQKKRKQGDVPEGVESKVRSYANGWVFARDGVQAPECVVSQSIAAVSALGLDFAAVDVGWTEKGNIATVYECNTAPGLEGTSITKYAEALRNYLQSL